VPNGQVTVASNLTRTWSRANMVVTVSYAEDTDHVFGVIDRTGEELARDPDWSGDIIEAPKALGADVTLSLERSPEEREAAVRQLTAGRGADVVIEAAGNPAAIPEGFRLLRDGGTYVIAGHYTDVGSVTVNFHTDVNRKHADVRGQWGTDFRHLYRALTLLATSVFFTAAHPYPLRDLSFVFFIGLLLGLFRLQGRSQVRLILAHGAFNLVLTAIA